jgi:2-keto-4-pentenoate hydratase/2-oxohepta-3-ene-1,7-dioic acid hydratase in catechol pathway
MKLLRYGPKGQEKPGMLDAGGKIRDLSGIIKDLGADVLSPAGLQKLRAIDAASLPEVTGSPRMGVPIAAVGKFIAIGLNYSDHAAETGNAIPKEPIVFMKANSCITGPNDTVMLAKNSVKTDWEVELGIVIGSRASNVGEADALKHVAGYCVVNDVSERYWQIERGPTWDKGKGCDTYGPIGPFVVTADEIADPQKLGLWLDVNGKRMQTGNTDKMVFGVQHLVAYVSQFMTLNPGDVITTGTPPGVGMGMKPPVFLKPGDTMRLGIDGLGEQQQKVIAYEG